MKNGFTRKNSLAPLGRGLGRGVKAFTLAEVLITLGVIGVVSAMTMPTLIQNYRKHTVETKLKRVYTVINQAIKLSENEYGEVSGWDDWTDASDLDERLTTFDKYIGKHIKILKTERRMHENGYEYADIYFTDGSILSMPYYGDISFYINKKALLNPRKGVNSFIFRFAPTAKSDENKYHYNKGFEPYAWDWQGTKDDLYHSKRAGYGCGEKYNNYCTKLIQYNGWQIPDDYPIRF